MTKKKLKKKVLRKPAGKKSVAPVVDSAREIWLAGLGAFNVAQQESGRIIEQGSKLFEKLVEEGSKVESKTRKNVEGVVNEFRGDVDKSVNNLKQQADSVRRQATDNWDKLEKIFEDRVARALAGLGIPNNEDISDLAEKVQKLAGQVADLSAKKSAARPPVKAKVKSPARTADKKVSAKAPKTRKPTKKKLIKKAAKPAAIKKAS